MTASAIATAIGCLAIRDHRRQRAQRRGLFNKCRDVLTNARISFGDDDFPSLEGSHEQYALRADLIPDTMTIRRLPQLWLCVTLFNKRPGRPEFAVLVRPSGNDFFSLTQRFHHRLNPTSGMPWEVLVRGDGDGAQALLQSLAQPLAELLSDPRTKEVAITERGLRIIRQAAEGQRGEHLLLRQAVFDDAGVSAFDLETIVTALERLCERLAGKVEERAA
jgi:hypothetical protein